jgi:hypothetical protein
MAARVACQSRRYDFVPGGKVDETSMSGSAELTVETSVEPLTLSLATTGCKRWTELEESGNSFFPGGGAGDGEPVLRGKWGIPWRRRVPVWIE